jgi:2-keto-4-pentenoate hydratase/2-oxohepta-3-ene-1,7-dioic acid hydratase in catechol pathway
MRLVTYRSDRGSRAGVLRGRRVLDAWDLIGEEPGLPSLRELLLRGLVDAVATAAEEAPPDSEVEPSWLEVPVPDPEKIICIGLNHRSHAEEAGLDPPTAPTIFAKFRNALVPSGTDVMLPAAGKKVDYEAEVAFVIGRRCKEAGEAQALDSVAGYMLLNDLSARDLQFATPQWMPGKVFDGAAPCGPALVTPDEAGAHDAIEIELTLNGQTMQRASTADLIFSVPALVAHLSTLMTLEPGDIVSTGTPAGVGSVRRPRVWLKAGDQIVVSSPTLGRLETEILA